MTPLPTMFIAPPPLQFSSPPNLIFCSGPPNYFSLKFLGPPLKLGGGSYHDIVLVLQDESVSN